jgi:outer membrane protein TolC
LNHKDTESTEKTEREKLTEQEELALRLPRSQASAGPILFRSSRCPLCLCGSFSEGDEVESAAFPPALPPAFAEYAIDLETALGLAGAENPTIALAREAVRASRAEQLQAQVLLFPTLNAGMNLHIHRGNLLASSGIIRDVNSQLLYAGWGARTVGAETLAFPGLRVFAQVADAIYEPVAARQRVAARRFDLAATGNAVLLEVADRYLALAGAEALLQMVRQSESELAEVVRVTANFARTGQGRQSDADRARSQALLLRTEEQRAEEEIAVASAELARLLNLDPAVRLRADAGQVPLIELVDPRQPLEELVQLAVRNRPEVGAWAALVAESETRLRQERVRPFVPLLSLGLSAGSFGGGSNMVTPRFGNFDERVDFDVWAVWSLQNLGFGNLAWARRRRAQVNEALAERAQVIDQVRREVAEAQAESLARRQEVELARRRTATALEGYRLDLIRTKNLEGRPIEVLNSLNLLVAAREDLVRALVGYSQAQFRLFVSLGQPPTAALNGEGCR